MFTVTGLSKEHLMYIRHQGVRVEQRGPGYYVYTDRDDIKSFLKQEGYDIRV